MKASRFYHITSEDWGYETTLSPRYVVNGQHFPARICVSPTIVGCLVAAPDKTLSGIVKVYETSTALAIACSDEWDAWCTKEHWLLKPHTFTYRLSIPS